MRSSYYDILGISEGASEDDIRRAYRKKAKQYHPDINKSPDAHTQFLLIKKAYESLLNGNTTYSSGSSNPMSSYEAYMAYKKAQEEKLKQEARRRYQEFLKNRSRFRKSVWYYPTLIFVYLAAALSYIFAACVIFLCAYIIHKTHIVFVLLMFPFISGGVYFIKCTGNWYKEAKRYF